MKRISTTPTVLPSTNMGAVGKAWDEVSASFDRFCLAAGIDALGAMMEKDAEEACGARHARSEGRRGHRWGRTQGKLGFHAGKVTVERPRVRDLAGQELSLPSWDRAVAEDWLGKWAMNLMLINVSTRKFRRAVRLPEGDVPAPAGAGVSKSAASRHFVALSAARMKEWMGADLSALDIMVVQIDGIHISEHLVLVAALGIDSQGFAVLSSATARRRSPRRSGAASGATRRSSAARFTRPGISWSVYRRLCMPRSGACCARPGNSTTRRRRLGSRIRIPLKIGRAS